jgi:DMSO/TMAO reductase YedYZ molybdopterin-dependent catalytic subunit
MKQETALLICPTVFADNEMLGGFALTSLLTEANINSGATQLVFSSLDNLQETVALSDALTQNMFLALTMDGQTITQAHGYPLRLVRPGKIGVYWFKCISDIEVS